MKTKQIPALLMLVAGLIASIVMRIMHYPLVTMLWILLGVLALFYVIGSVFVVLMDKFEEEDKKEEEEPAEEEIDDEGAVVEKTQPSE